MDPYQAIRRVLTRRKFGRQESLQLVLTCLIVGGVYPVWGTRTKPMVRRGVAASACRSRREGRIVQEGLRVQDQRIHQLKHA